MTETCLRAALWPGLDHKRLRPKMASLMSRKPCLVLFLRGPLICLHSCLPFLFLSFFLSPFLTLSLSSYPSSCLDADQSAEWGLFQPPPRYCPVFTGLALITLLPVRYSCLENPMDRGAWCRLLSMGVTKSRIRLSDFTSLHVSNASPQISPMR